MYLHMPLCRVRSLSARPICSFVITATAATVYIIVYYYNIYNIYLIHTHILLLYTSQCAPVAADRPCVDILYYIILLKYSVPGTDATANNGDNNNNNNRSLVFVGDHNTIIRIYAPRRRWSVLSISHTHTHARPGFILTHIIIMIMCIR